VTRIPARIVATALTATDTGITAAIVLTEDSATTYSITEDNVTAEWLAGVLDACGVPAWEELRGRTVYAIRGPEADDPVRGLEHLATEPGGRFMFPDVAADVTIQEDNTDE
jgi:hypothetical protein